MIILYDFIEQKLTRNRCFGVISEPWNILWGQGAGEDVQNEQNEGGGVSTTFWTLIKTALLVGV